jgi:hypothetical protein
MFQRHTNIIRGIGSDEPGRDVRWPLAVPGPESWPAAAGPGYRPVSAGSSSPHWAAPDADLVVLGLLIP